MNWMLLTALTLAFGVIVGNLMLLRYLDKLPGHKASAKPDIPAESSPKANSGSQDKPTDTNEATASKPPTDNDQS